MLLFRTTVHGGDCSVLADDDADADAEPSPSVLLDEGDDEGDDAKSLSRASNDGRGKSCSWFPSETWVTPTVLRVATIPRPPSIEERVDGDRKSPARTTAEGRIGRCGVDVAGDDDDDDDDDNFDRKVCSRGRFASSYTSLMATIRRRANVVVPTRVADATVIESNE
jgi:hypothetical protein